MEHKRGGGGRGGGELKGRRAGGLEDGRVRGREGEREGETACDGSEVSEKKLRKPGLRSPVCLHLITMLCVCVFVSDCHASFGPLHAHTQFECFGKTYVRTQGTGANQ